MASGITQVTMVSDQVNLKYILVMSSVQFSSLTNETESKIAQRSPAPPLSHIGNFLLISQLGVPYFIVYAWFMGRVRMCSGLFPGKEQESLKSNLFQYTDIQTTRLYSC